MKDFLEEVGPFVIMIFALLSLPTIFGVLDFLDHNNKNKVNTILLSQIFQICESVKGSTTVLSENNKIKSVYCHDSFSVEGK